jgi:predicted RND superfamily exporter protein
MDSTARALNIKINFLNVIALPIAFGIGVDYASNLLARVQQEGRKRVASIVASTGGAVSLASLMTIIGYTSLLIAGNQGFVSFGQLAVLGEVATLTAATLILPSYLRWRYIREQVRKGALKPGPAPTPAEQEQAERKGGGRAA